MNTLFRKEKIGQLTKALFVSSLWTITLAVCMVISTIALTLLSANLTGTLGTTINQGIDALYGMRNLSLSSYFNGEFFAMIAKMTQEEIVSISKFIVISMIFAYGMYVMLCGIHSAVKKDIFHRVDARTVLASVAIITAVNALLEPLIVIYMGVNPGTISDTMMASNALATSGGTALTFLSTAVLAPITEELMFRRGMQKNLQKVNPTFAIIFTSVSFGVLHGNVIQSTFAILMGLILGVLYYKTDNLTVTSICHIVVNATAVMIECFGFPELSFYCLVAIVFSAAYIMYEYHTNGFEFFGKFYIDKPIQVPVTILH